MSLTRETYYAALFAAAQVKAAGSFSTISRKLKHWTDVAPEECPAMFQIQSSETKRQERGKPKVWELRGSFYIYVHTNSQQLGDDTIIPSQMLNPLLDAVESVFDADDLSNAVCTLGGLVSHAWIDGTIETSEGMLGDHEVAIVPWAMLVPTN